MLSKISKCGDKLCIYACKDEMAYRLEDEEKDIRADFFRDIDRIIYSLSYMRYIDKTQVFSNIRNDHLSKRIIHVQFVSKIARTIGRVLGLNEDLIEAASLGHDFGHVPFGHIGESILNEISLKHNQGFFYHNIQSVRILMHLENHGKGSNITVQVLDAIMCHNGEVLKQKLCPIKKTKEEFLKEYESCYSNPEVLKNLCSMTLEGCLIRICDIISYVGRDIEDAIRIGLINKDMIPSNIKKTLGSNNKDIVNTLILDIIDNSIGKPYIAMSDKVYGALRELMKFNYENIYFKANTENDINQYKKMYNLLFNTYLNQLRNNEKGQDIYTIFLNDMSSEYITNNTNERIVIDFIAGMTDEYFKRQYNKYV